MCDNPTQHTANICQSRIYTYSRAGFTAIVVAELANWDEGDCSLVLNMSSYLLTVVDARAQGVPGPAASTLRCIA